MESIPTGGGSTGSTGSTAAAAASSGGNASQTFPSPPPLSMEQLQLLQLCFGEHEFGMRALEPRFAPAVEGTPAAEDGSGGNVAPVVLDFDPATFIHEKSEHGISLDVLCRDLVSFERYLQSRIMQHVHEEVYEAFVSVSGELVGLEDHLKRILQPLTATKSKVEHAVHELSVREERVLRAVEAAELNEQRRVFHLTVTRCFLLHDGLADAVAEMEALPFVASILKHANDKTQDTTLPNDHDLNRLQSVAQDLYDITASVDRLAPPPVSDAVQFQQYQTEVSELRELVSDARAHIVRIWNHIFLSCHRMFTSAGSSNDSERLMHVLRALMQLYAPICPSEFFTLYREHVVRPMAEDVLSWKASAQARTSIDHCVALLDELRRTLEATVLPLASLIREVFGAAADTSPTSPPSPTSPSNDSKSDSTSSSSSVVAVHPIPTIFWPPICNALVTRLVFLFLPGIASTFHTNFVAAHRLVSVLENHCASFSELQAFRGSTETTLWTHKWNLDVYHTLRSSEASERAKKIYVSLPQGLLADPASATAPRHIANNQSAQLQATTEMMELCQWLFSPEVFLFPLGHRLLRDAAIIIRDFASAAAHSVTELLDGVKANDAQLSPEQVTRIALVASDLMFLSESFVSVTLRTTLEERSLLHSASSGADGSSTTTTSSATTSSSSMMHLNPVANVLTLVRDYVDQNGVGTVRQALMNYLTTQCLQGLQNLKTIKAAYSHTKKPLPSSPSWFIPSILEPITKFKTAVTSATKAQGGQNSFYLVTVPALIRAAVDEVTEKFRELTKDVIISARRMEESLGRLRRKREEAKGGASAVAANTAPETAPGRITNETATDRDKMVVQLYLDAHEYGSLLRPLGVNKENYEPLLRILKLCRRANWILSGDNSPEPAEVEEDE